MKKFVRFFIILLFSLSTLYAKVHFTQEEKEYIKNHQVVTMGADYNWPPFDFIDKNALPSGLSNDYLNLISKKSGLKFKIYSGIWSDILESMKHKKYDGLTSAVKTTDREKYLNFTTPYISVPMAIVMQINSSSVQTLDDLKGKTVSVNKGSYIHEWLVEKYPDIKLHLSRSNEESLEMLSFGKVDAYIGNLAVSTYIVNKNLLNNLKVVAKLENFKTLVSIAIDKDKPLLFSIIQKSLDDVSIQESQKIKSKWNEKINTPNNYLQFTKKQQNWIDNHKTIRYVIDNNFEPIEYLSTDKVTYSGIASSFMELLGQKTGITFIRVPTEVWSQSVEKIDAREADMYACLTQTPSREKVVNFSKPYIIMPQVFVTQKNVGFLSSMTELYGKKVVLVKGYALTEIIKKEHPKIDVIVVENIMEAFKKVVKGDAYAYLDLLPVASTYIQKNGLSNLKISGISQYQSKFRMALRNDWDETGIEIINKVLDSISEDKKNAIYAKWISVKYDKTIDYTLLFEIGTVFLLMIGASLFWNRKLSLEIQKRKEVELELQELNKKLIQTRNEAQSANKAKSNFLSNMSHEIRTPMNSILGFAELLEDRIEDKKLKSFVQTIRSAGGNLLALINDVLDFSKIESGKLEIVKKSTNVRKMFEDIVRIFVLQAEQKGLNLEFKVDKKMPDVLFLDALRLREILINLIGNAIKFTDEGFVKVVVDVNSVYKHLSKIDIEIKVEDSGIGIAKDAQEKIFNVFEQQDNQDAQKYGGTGLGLAISKKLAILMDGTLEVQSKLAKGSTFILKLKNIDIASMQDEVQNDDDLVQYDALDFEEAVILVADDVEQNRNLIKESFNDSKIEIIEAINGADAIEKIKTTKVDLILMDIRMPILDGYGATKIIKESFDIPIIALTASIMDEDLDKIAKWGFDGYLRKPVSRNKLYTQAAKFLAHVTRTQDEKSALNVEVKNREDLKNFLNELDVDVLYTTAIHSNSIEAISKFASVLLDLSKKHNIEYMQNYSQTLLDKIETFEVQSIESMLQEYKSVIQKLNDIEK